MQNSAPREIYHYSLSIINKRNTIRHHVNRIAAEACEADGCDTAIVSDLYISEGDFHGLWIVDVTMPQATTHEHFERHYFLGFEGAYAHNTSPGFGVHGLMTRKDAALKRKQFIKYLSAAVKNVFVCESKAEFDAVVIDTKRAIAVPPLATDTQEKRFAKHTLRVDERSNNNDHIGAVNRIIERTTMWDDCDRPVVISEAYQRSGFWLVDTFIPGANDKDFERCSIAFAVVTNDMQGTYLNDEHGTPFADTQHASCLRRLIVVQMAHWFDTVFSCQDREQFNAVVDHYADERTEPPAKQSIESRPPSSQTLH